jgi:hypothetical protein
MIGINQDAPPPIDDNCNKSVAKQENAASFKLTEPWPVRATLNPMPAEATFSPKAARTATIGKVCAVAFRLVLLTS